MSRSPESIDLDSIHIKEWNSGVFSASLRDANITPRNGRILHGHPAPPDDSRDPAAPALKTGTVEGTRIALTEVYTRTIQRYGSFFDVANIEPSIPQNLTRADRLEVYTWSDPTVDSFPPHLEVIPKKNQATLESIFDAMRLIQAGSIMSNVLPESWLGWLHGDPHGGTTMAALVDRNTELREEGAGIFSEPNLGDREDWYSDAVFAQQQLTGTNPVTIQHASHDWVHQFKSAAAALGNTAAVELLDTADPTSLYVQDCSYFRAAVGVDPGATLLSDDAIRKRRYACAAVSLFQLHNDGKLHPLAIVIDYKGNMQDSVKIFNKRLRPSDPTDSEASDWPWRYAKTAAMVSDWTRHELTIHLVNTHLVEEAVIVATQRAFDTSHIVFRLLEPHWFRTLSLNAAARSSLVPSVVVPLSGISPTQVHAFVMDAYSRFDWVQQYVPNDLARRGFPPDKLTDAKYHNYAYAKDIHLLWQTLRLFVDTVIRITYKSDQDVLNDDSVSRWHKEMRGPKGGQMSSFPIIKTIDQLVDAVTMAIHIASPQHSAVNYLQTYYHAFVPAKPPSFYQPMPTSEAALHAITDKALTKALPSNRPTQWLLASHLPYLLSIQVATEQNLPNYAISVAKVAQLNNEEELRIAAIRLYLNLAELKVVFKQTSDQLDPGTIPYMVLDPDVTAVSILI